MTPVHVVVTCTKRKTRAPAEGLRLGGVGGGTPEARAAAWMERLRAAEGSTATALELYAGDHWSVVRGLAEAGAGAGREVRLWVCSAGYGLVPSTAALFPYSATFSTGHPDAVHASAGLARKESHRRWWRALAGWEGPVPGAPRTLRDLVAREPAVPVLVVGSPAYLEPMADDLRGAAGALRDGESLLLLSGGAGALPGLERQHVPFGARLQGRLGGAMMSLNARVAREVLASDGPLRAGEVAARLGALARDLPEFRYPERTRMSDDEVRA